MGITLHRAPTGEPGRGSSAGIFERKEKKYIWVSFLTQRTLRFYVWGPSGTLAKEQGPPELISDYGAQRTCL